MLRRPLLREQRELMWPGWMQACALCLGGSGRHVGTSKPLNRCPESENDGSGNKCPVRRAAHAPQPCDFLFYRKCGGLRHFQIPWKESLPHGNKRNIFSALASVLETVPEPVRKMYSFVDEGKYLKAIITEFVPSSYTLTLTDWIDCSDFIFLKCTYILSTASHTRLLEKIVVMGDRQALLVFNISQALATWIMTPQGKENMTVGKESIEKMHEKTFWNPPKAIAWKSLNSDTD